MSSGDNEERDEQEEAPVSGWGEAHGRDEDAAESSEGEEEEADLGDGSEERERPSVVSSALKGAAAGAALGAAAGAAQHVARSRGGDDPSSEEEK